MIDVWKTCWNVQRDTVLPCDVNQVVRNYKHWNRRMIIPYLQPHRPYLPCENLDTDQKKQQLEILVVQLT